MVHASSLRIKNHVSFLHIVLIEELPDTKDKVKKQLFGPYRAYKENGLLKLQKRTTTRRNEQFLSAKYVRVDV